PGGDESFVRGQVHERILCLRLPAGRSEAIRLSGEPPPTADREPPPAAGTARDPVQAYREGGYHGRFAPEQPARLGNATFAAHLEAPRVLGGPGVLVRAAVSSQ